jgi:hypothetical protein
MHAVGNQQEQGDTGTCGIVTHIHYRKRALYRVAEALGKVLKTLSKGFVECGTR